MATSLVSTGVQFPDSTIQTTAATGSPSMATNGSTILMVSNSNYWSYGSGASNLFGASNISTTAPALIYPNPEINNNLWYNPGAGQSCYSYSANDWNGNGYYGQYGRMQYDFYTNRFVITLATVNAGSYFTSMNLYSTDGVNWAPFQNAANVVASAIKVSAFNNYTGARIVTFSNSGSWYSNPIRTYAAADAYNDDSNTYTSYSPSNGGYSYAPSFIDTGTQSTSKFFVTNINNGASSLVVCSRAANDDAGSFSEYSLGNYNASSRVIGMAAEIMFYSYNKGVFYSTDMGANWNRYNFGNNVDGTSTGNYWYQMAWNGSYWLGTLNNNNNRIATKAMGSGTSWTALTNLSSFQYTNQYVTGVAWNPTLGFWIIAKSGQLYTNTSSDPNSGSWTLLRNVPFASGQGSGGTTYSPMYVKATQTYNY